MRSNQIPTSGNNQLNYSRPLGNYSASEASTTPVNTALREARWASGASTKQVARSALEGSEASIQQVREAHSRRAKRARQAKRAQLLIFFARMRDIARAKRPPLGTDRLEYLVQGTAPQILRRARSTAKTIPRGGGQSFTSFALVIEQSAPETRK